MDTTSELSHRAWTGWTVSDELWDRVQPLIPRPVRDQGRHYQRREGAGRPAKPPRLVFEAIVHVLKTGAPWQTLPAERFGCSSAVHRKFRQWSRDGFFHTLWQAGLTESAELAGITWNLNPDDDRLLVTPVRKRAWRPVASRKRKTGESAQARLETRFAVGPGS